MSIFDNSLCKSLWGDAIFYYSFHPSTSSSSGLVRLWDYAEVDVWATISFEHVLVIVWHFLKSTERYVLLKVYAPCDVFRQQVLWENIYVRLNSFADHNICICGDFNVVRCVEEIRSVGLVFRPSGITNFNQLIDGNILIDLPLRGCSYTWYRRDVRYVSHIDPFLLSENWCLTLPNYFQMASSRGLSGIIVHYSYLLNRRTGGLNHFVC